jgi:hypothetical protein
VVRFEAKTSESGLIARLGDGLAVGTVVGVEVAAGRVVGEGLGDAAPIDATGDGDAAPIDATGDGDAEGTLAGDDPQAARTNATARTAVPRATITRHPLASHPPATTLIGNQTQPECETLQEPPMVRLRVDQLRGTTRALPFGASRTSEGSVHRGRLAR